MYDTGPMAGRNAMQQLSEHTDRENQLNDRQAMLDGKEMGINGRLAADAVTQIKMDGSFKAIYEASSPDLPEGTIC